jgi:hypothetical protein
MPPCFGTRYNRGMPFVVKITNSAYRLFWLSPANEDGDRTLTVREHADTFQTFEDANVASRKLREVFKGAAFMFSVESTD